MKKTRKGPKPTPGPYVVRRNAGGAEVRGRFGVLIAHFGTNMTFGANGDVHIISRAEAWRNAQALVKALREGT